MGTAPAGDSVARGALLNVIGQGAPLLVAAGTIPVIADRLGVEAFGLLALIWAALGYFGIFDLGLSRSTTWLVAEAIGQADDSAVPRIIRTSILLHLLVGSAAGAVLAIATPAIVGGVFRVSPLLVDDARASFRLLSVFVPVVVVGGAYRGILEAYRRFDLVNAVRIVAGAATFGLPLVVLLTGAGLPAITLGLALTRLAAGAVYAILCGRLTAGSGSRVTFDRRIAAALFSFGRWVVVAAILYPILLYVDRTLIGSLVSVSAVAYYTAPYEMVSRLAVIPAGLALALFPTLRLMGEDRAGEIVRLSERSVRVLVLIMTPVAVLLAAFARPILTLWLGPVFAQESAGVLQVLALGMIANTLTHVPFTVMHSLGRPDLTVKIQLVELPVYALVAWYLTRTAGINGAAVAWSTFLVADAIVYFVLAASALSRWRPAVREAGGRLRPVALLAGLFAGAVGLLNLVVAVLALKVALALVLTSVFGWVAWVRILDTRDRDAMRSALRLARSAPGR